MNRWAIFIDIEGVSKIFPADEIRFFAAFDALLSAISCIGATVYPDTPSRLSAHQVGGDGLLIVSEFAEGKAEVPISIAVLLMQILLVNGAVAKGGISEGGFGDTQSCFPALQSLPRSGDHCYRIGRGLLTTFPVMGTALINAHRFVTLPPRGCRLTVDHALLGGDIPAGVMISSRQTDLVVVDWIHTKTTAMEYILDRTGLVLPVPQKLELALTAYVRSTGELGRGDWGRNSLIFNGCEGLNE